MRSDWKDKLLVAFVLLVILLVGSFSGYVGGRIMLPAMGLMAPGYWTWFWFTFWSLGAAFFFLFLRELVR